MLDEYKNEQPSVYKILKTTVEKKRCSHAYLFALNGYSKGMDVALSLAKYLVCPYNKSNKTDCGQCKQCHRIDQGNYPEIKIIQADGLWIKKEQLLDLQKEFNTKPIENSKKIYIISNAEKLNDSAANSILKFLEEPEDNIIAILISDNKYQVLKTIVSRCQIITFNRENKIETIDDSELLNKIGKHLYNNKNDVENFIINTKNIEKVENIINFIKYYEKNKKDTLLYMNKIWTQYFKEKEEIIQAMEIMVLFYKDIINSFLGRPFEFFHKYNEEINAILITNTLETLSKKLNIILIQKEKLKFNVNSALFMDKLIILLERGEI